MPFRSFGSGTGLRLDETSSAAIGSSAEAEAFARLKAVLSDGSVGIVTILHERMHQIERLQDDLKG